VREHIDLPTLEALEAEWDRHPPAHHLVASYLGYKPPAPRGKPHEVTDIAPVLAELGDVPIRKVAPVDTSAFDAQFPPQETANG
jgi:hypothetical protein